MGRAAASQGGLALITAECQHWQHSPGLSANLLFVLRFFLARHAARHGMLAAAKGAAVLPA